MALPLGDCMTTAGKLDRGRESFRQQAWAGASALLSSADQVPRSVGEGLGQVSAQFRELELEELGQTPARLVEHVVARLSDSGAVSGEFMSKAVRALGAQASVPSEVPEPEDVGPDDPGSAAVRAFITRHTGAPRRADLSYRRDSDGVSDSMHRMRVAARRLRSGLRVFRSLLDRERANELRDELRRAGRGARVGGADRPARDAHCPPSRRCGPRRPVGERDGPDPGAAGAGKGRRFVSVRSSPRVARTAQRRHDGGGGSAGQPGAAAAVPQRLATAGEAGRSRPRGRVGPARGAPDAEWHQELIAAKRARYAGEAVAPVLGEEAAAFARQMEKVTEILAEHQDAADAGAAIRELATSADAPASFTLGVLHAADASGLRRPAAGSRRCGPKSAAASGADG